MILYIGNNANNKKKGTSGPDDMYGRGGNDTLKGLGNADFLYGENGNDKLFGGGSSDYLSGGKGKDLLKGGPGNDTLDGGPGKDKLKGGPGADFLYGGRGNDKLWGGKGNDWFYFLENFGKDVIKDFVAGPGTPDVIAIEATQVNNFADLMALTSNVNGSAVIKFDNKNQITIEGVKKGQLHEDDFYFFLNM